jgi:hypothetical protein
MCCDALLCYQDELDITAIKRVVLRSGSRRLKVAAMLCPVFPLATSLEVLGRDYARHEFRRRFDCAHVWLHFTPPLAQRTTVGTFEVASDVAVAKFVAAATLLAGE